MLRRGAALLLVGALIVVVLPTHASAPPPEWKAKAAIPTARGFFGIAELNGKVYVAGGYESGNVISASVEVYDPSTDTWSAAADLPTPRWGLSLIAVSGRLVAVGGSTSTPGWPGMTAVTEIYDPATNQWTSGPPLPEPRIGASGFAIGGIVYVWAGSWDGGASANASRFAYDIGSNAWTRAADLPDAFVNAGTAVVGDTVYLTGGWMTRSEVRVARPAAGEWEVRAPMPHGRGTHASEDLNGMVYVIGGVTADTTECLPSRTVERYDPLDGTWSNTTAYPEAVEALGAVRVGTMLYAMGGYRCGFVSNGTYALTVYGGDAERFDWTPIVVMGAISLAVIAVIGAVLWRQKRILPPKKS